jgi:hypothetical protein
VQIFLMIMTTRRRTGVLVGGAKGVASHVDRVTSTDICLDTNRVGVCLGCTADVDPVGNERIYPCQEPKPDSPVVQRVA